MTADVKTVPVEPIVADKVLSLLRAGKRVNWIAQAWNVPRPHVIQLGLNSGLRLRPKDDVMTAAPAALDIDDDAQAPQLDGRGLPVAPPPRSDEVPSRLLPPQRPPAPETPEPAEVASDSEPENTPDPIPAPAKADTTRQAEAARAAALAYKERERKLGGRAAIVEWAKANGFPVPPGNLGRIRNEVLDAYQAAHPAQVEEKPPQGFEVFHPEAKPQASEPPQVEEKTADEPQAFQSPERPAPSLRLGNIKRSVEHVARLCSKAVVIEQDRTDKAYRATLVALAEAHVVLDLVAALIENPSSEGENS